MFAAIKKRFYRKEFGNTLNLITLKSTMPDIQEAVQ